MTEDQNLIAHRGISSIECGQLGIIQNLLERLDVEGILYCHWKSNEHLGAAVAGNTDLDILFEEGKHARIVELLQRMGFAPFRTVWFHRYPGIEDFIGIDAEKGRVVHVHAHFKLVLGEKHVKSYHLPWEDNLLKARVRDEECRIYRSDPVWEMLLLIIRGALKLRKRDRWLHGHAKCSRAVGSGSDREMTWLKERVSLEDLCRLAEKYCVSLSPHAIDRLYREGLSSSALEESRRLIVPAFQKYRRYPKWCAAGVGLVREYSYFISCKLKKTIMPSLPIRRTIVGEGLIIAILGADGSGKSTVATELTKELSRKITVIRIYMGSGSGPSSFLRWSLKAIPRCIRRLRGNPVGHIKEKHSFQDKKARGTIRTFLNNTFDVTLALALAREKRMKLKRAWYARRKGIFVVCDRYPQTETEGYNDGPLLGHLLRSQLRFLRLLGRWERSCYARTALYPPDLVIRLLGPTDVLGNRRPEMNLETIHRKQEGIRAMRFPRSTRVVDIDAGLSLEEVIAKAMGAVGSLIARNTGDEPLAVTRAWQHDSDDR